MVSARSVDSKLRAFDEDAVYAVHGRQYGCSARAGCDGREVLGPEALTKPRRGTRTRVALQVPRFAAIPWLLARAAPGGWKRDGPERPETLASQPQLPGRHAISRSVLVGQELFCELDPSAAGFFAERRHLRELALHVLRDENGAFPDDDLAGDHHVLGESGV